MMIAVELDKREEFDRFWTLASNVRKQKDRRGPRLLRVQLRHGHHDGDDACDDPYGEPRW